MAAAVNSGSSNDRGDWYIVRGADGFCEVLTGDRVPPRPTDGDGPRNRWGPYGSQGEAIAKRVGLIRAGKCQPR